MWGIELWRKPDFNCNLVWTCGYSATLCDSVGPIDVDRYDNDYNDGNDEDEDGDDNGEERSTKRTAER